MGAGFLFTIVQNSLYRGSLYQGLSLFPFEKKMKDMQINSHLIFIGG